MRQAPPPRHGATPPLNPPPPPPPRPVATSPPPPQGTRAPPVVRRRPQRRRPQGAAGREGMPGWAGRLSAGPTPSARAGAGCHGLGVRSGGETWTAARGASGAWRGKGGGSGPGTRAVNGRAVKCVGGRGEWGAAVPDVSGRSAVNGGGTVNGAGNGSCCGASGRSTEHADGGAVAVGAGSDGGGGGARHGVGRDGGVGGPLQNKTPDPEGHTPCSVLLRGGKGAGSSGVGGSFGGCAALSGQWPSASASLAAQISRAISAISGARRLASDAKGFCSVG
eukprot:scaffold3946_cov118-Isochrysis_galbana.AAC.8